MKIGRNDPCPSGGAAKFKQCLEQHPRLQAKASLAEIWWVCDQWKAPIPSIEDLFQHLPARPPILPEKVHLLLDLLLRDDPAETDWAEFLRRLHRAECPDLAGIFRQIAREVPDKVRGKAFFYWGAAEYFPGTEMLREIAAGFGRLDAEGYDPDALDHLEDRLLVAGLEDETLQLCEHFLPIMEADEALTDYAVPQLVNRTVNLRLGRIARARRGTALDLKKIMPELMAGLPDDVGPEGPRTAAQILFGPVPGGRPTRADLSCLPAPKGKKLSDEEKYRTWNTVLRAAREAFAEGALPGQALCALDVVMEAVNRQLGQETAVGNLADLPVHEDLEGFVARAAVEIMGTNHSRARLVIIGLRLLTDFLARHEILDSAETRTAKNELVRLSGLLGA